MIIVKDERDHKKIIRCEGRLDATTSMQLENALNSLIEQKEKSILVDFGKVDYLSSAGMRLLLSMTKKLRSGGGKLVVFSMHDDVMEIIRMAGFEQILTICRDENQAVSSL